MAQQLSEARARGFLRAAREACPPSIQWVDVGNHNANWPRIPDELVPRDGRDPAAPRAITISVAHALSATDARRIRGLLRVVWAISVSEGYAYHENRSLWSWFASLWGHGVGPIFEMPTDHRFPVIEICLKSSSWVISKPALPGFLLELFDARECPVEGPAEAVFGPILAQLRPFVDDESLAMHPIRVALGLELCCQVTDSIYLLSTVAGVLPQVRERLTRDPDDGCDQEQWILLDVVVSGFKNSLSARELYGLRAIMQHCSVCITMGPTNYRDPRITDLRTVQIRAFLVHALRLRGFSSLGVVALDLSGPFCLDESFVGCVCSALPFTRSLRALTLTVRNDRSWMWLGYAMFHPEAANSTWRALNVLNSHVSRSDLAALEAHRSSANGADLLRETTVAGWQLAFTMPTLGVDRDRIRRTTLVAETNASIPVFDRQTQTPGCLFRLPKRSYVEVCDTATDFAGLRDPVCIISPGGGMGYVAKEGLHKLSEVIAVGLPHAALSDVQIHVGAADMPTLLELLGPAVRRWRSTNGRVTATNLAPRCAEIESMQSMPHSPDMPTFPTLRSLDMHCSLSQLEEVLSCLTERTPLLRSLVLRILQPYPYTCTDEDIASLAVLGKHIGGISRLRALVVAVTSQLYPPTLQETKRFYDPHRRRNALAFVSAATTAAASDRRGVGALDVELIRLILALASSRLVECIVSCGC